MILKILKITIIGYQIKCDTLPGIQTRIVRHQLVTLGVGEHLIAALTMALSESDVLVRLATERVQTEIGLLVANFAQAVVIERHL